MELVKEVETHRCNVDSLEGLKQRLHSKKDQLLHLQEALSSTKEKMSSMVSTTSADTEPEGHETNALIELHTVADDMENEAEQRWLNENRERP